jgi:hypothetical protein
MEVGIADISKNPSIFNGEDEILEIVDKKRKSKKYIAFPAKYEDRLKSIIEEIEYEKWLEVNKKALADSDDTFKEIAKEKLKDD